MTRVAQASAFTDLAERAGQFGGRLAAALVVLLILAGTARLLRPLVRRWLDRRQRASYTRVFLGVYGLLAWVVSFLLAMTLAFPSVQMVDLLTSLGILSLAVGFAFKGILENLLAGVLLIVRDPFKSGDEIRICGYEGIVEGITVRETMLRTYDGRRVLLPNSQVHSHALEVLTHYPLARTAFTLPVAPGADPQAVRAAVDRALQRVAGVVADPPPEAVLIDADAQALTVECRVWTTPDRRRTTAVRDAAIEEVLAAFRSARIPSPVDELVVELSGPRQDR